MRARLRGAKPGLRFKPDARTLRAGLNFTFATRLGDLDCLGEASGGFTFDGVIANAVEFAIDAELRVVAASLDDLIRMKRAAGRVKDRTEVERLAALRETREGRPDARSAPEENDSRSREGAYS